MTNEILMEKIVSLSKRRGFIWQGSEIYGGLGSIWHFGPLGVEMKNAIKRHWWATFVTRREDVVGIDGAILMHPTVWKASGHIDSFTDPLVECKKCNVRLRVDHILTENDINQARKFVIDAFEGWIKEEFERIEKIKGLKEEEDRFSQYLKNEGFSLQSREEFLRHKVELEDIRRQELEKGKKRMEVINVINEALKQKKYVGFIALLALEKLGVCPSCNNRGEIWTEPRDFNLLFKTFVGPIEDQKSTVYLRGETAQSMFTDFKLVLESSRQKVPFGIAQIGKCFRNEITLGNFIFRCREFEIAELEFFVTPGEDEKWFNKWYKVWKKFYLDLGINPEKLRDFEHPKESLSHYSKRTVDIEYNFPFGWSELAGVANRTDYDLSQHEKFSGKDLHYFDESTGKKYIPYVIEPTMGVERIMMVLLVDAYHESDGTDGREKGEVVMKLNPTIAPIQVGVFPLVKKDKLPEMAKNIYKELTDKRIRAFYDESGSIGRRYRRQDETGTPWCVTVDFDSLEDGAVTVRDRDTLKQERVKINELKNYIFSKLDLS